MNNVEKQTAKKEGKKRISGWLIALIVVAVLFITGAICCNTIGKAQGVDSNPPQSTVEIQK